MCADARAGAGATSGVTARRCLEPLRVNRRRSAEPDPARGRAGDDTSETGRGWFGVGHAMPMVHAWNHYCAVTAVFSVHHT